LEIISSKIFLVTPRNNAEVSFSLIMDYQLMNLKKLGTTFYRIFKLIVPSRVLGGSLNLDEWLIAIDPRVCGLL
jgi:hypothetical protein